MKKIRQKAFETNSSSSHSITISDKKLILDSIYPDEEGNITLTGGKFGWEWFKYNDALTKANYAAINFANNKEYTQMLIDVIKEQTHCENVILNFTTDWNDNYSYIDHESRGIVPTDKEKLRKFIFDKNSWLFGGNDNEFSAPDFYIVPKYTEEGIILPDFKYKLEIAGETFQFLEYPTIEQISETVHSLDVRYNIEEGKVETHPCLWKNLDIYFQMSGKNSIKDDFIVLTRENCLEMNNDEDYYDFYQRKEKFIEENIDNPEICYKLPYVISKR